ncbi:MAG: acetyl-CoA C-acetyltransferase, partial [Oligoflexia bacterium]|nr:acetyl-CoA C-acetyltransferase [Oligoflexia bacterium]
MTTSIFCGDSSDEVYILSGSRTPIGSYMGKLATVSAPNLAGFAIADALSKSQLSPESVNELFIGEVLSTGVGQAPARQAALCAKLPPTIPCTTVNKVCGSGLKSIILGVQSIISGESEVVVAGGMENMSQAPHFLPGSRGGMKFGEATLKDSMQWDGLWDVYSNTSMGVVAEQCVKKFGFTREQQDQFAITSFKRAQAAIKEGIFNSEICAVTIADKTGKTAGNIINE